MNYYLTGDTHGDFSRISTFVEEMKTTKDDVLIILGDAGVNFVDELRDHDKKEFLERLSITILCIHGNHEKRPETISTYQECKWKGGTVYLEHDFPKIMFAKDGEVYDLDGEKAIVIGGAYSIDKFYRLTYGLGWFDDEQPSDEIKKRVEEKLQSCNWKIDYVFSHTVPLKYEPVENFIEGVDQSSIDKSTEIWLDEIENKLEYKKWYAGHYHCEKRIDKLEIMFSNYTVLGSPEKEYEKLFV